MKLRTSEFAVHRLMTRDDIEVTVPNAIMGNTKIINESGGPAEKFRIRIAVGVAYGSDIDKVREILMEIALADEAVCEDPDRGFDFAPSVRPASISNYCAGSINRYCEGVLSMRLTASYTSASSKKR